MLLRHAERPGRGVRLAYCLNLHPAETQAELLEGIRAVTLPLRERIAPGRPFGVGLYLAADLARELAAAPGACAPLRALLDEHGLDAFTLNAFPYGGFHGRALKERVFEPTWLEPERARFTRDVLQVARALDAPGARAGHLSVSTHCGAHARHPRAGERGAFARAFAALAQELAERERRSGVRAVLALEPEPRSLCNDTAQLADLRARIAAAGQDEAGRAAVARHLGACLDTCHAAVEFEEPERALSNATAGGAPLGKLQFTCALELPRPGRGDGGARARELLDLDEPRYLHQVTGARGAERLRADDLPDLAARLAGPQGEAWRACEAWRCHFHVPVDLERVGAGGLATTRASCDALLAAALRAPERWGCDELHVELETYTWSVLPGAARGRGELVDGLEREYAHVLGELARAGWRPA